jgi:NadR type nicotinamide-nucleotide adenylyltransferase
MTTALVLGKFAPLHNGHMLLLDLAVSSFKNQIFVVYDSPSVTNIPLAIRATWLRALYPSAEVIEAWGGPEEVGLEPQVMAAQEEFLLQILAHRKVTHFISSEPYGDHVAKRLGAESVQLDPNRSKVPISASKIRADQFGNRHFVHEIVYRDLIRKVVFLGAPSTGKSSIAKECAEALSDQWMPEYGREYWEANAVDRRLTMVQLEEIARGHLARENELLLQARKYFFVDTDASTTANFAHYYHGSVSPYLASASKAAAQRYDLTFLCENDFPFADTEDRSGAVQQADFQRQIEQNLIAQRRPFIRLTGSITQRVEKVRQALETIPHFSNPAEWS